MKLLSLIKQPTYRSNLLLAALVAAIALATALVAQYVYLLYPCELCLYQRYPYVGILIVAIPVLLFIRSLKLQKYTLYLCIALLLLDAGIAGYHSGVEMDIFAGPDACSSTDSGEQTLEELRAAIMGAPLVSCKQAMAHIGGLSIAAWNMIAALLAAGLLVGLTRRIKKGDA